MTDTLPVAQPMPKGIYVGQTWTGRSGMGPTIRLTDMDLDKGSVEYTPLDTSDRNTRPRTSTTISELVRSFRPDRRVSG